MATTRKSPKGKQDARSQGLKHNRGTLDIPELTAAEARLVERRWSPEEVAILRRYYARGMVRPLVEYFAEHFPPGRTADGIRWKAFVLGLTTPKREDTERAIRRKGKGT